MKIKSTLFLVILLIFLFELIVSILVFTKIGNERLLISIFRTAFQILVLIGIASSKNKILMYLFVFYHLIVGIQFFMSGIVDIVKIIFGCFHLLIAVLVYFNEEIDNKIFK